VSTFIATLVALIPFYLIGCFPTGILIAHLHGVSITTQGSGNVGATNVSRVIGKKAGIQTLLGDLFKGIIAVALAFWFAPHGAFAAYAAVAVVCGHCFSLPPKLKGGKGVATALGVTLVLFPLGGLIAIASFGLVFGFTKIVSVASLAAAGAVSLAALVSNQPEPTSFALVGVSLVILYRHRENIKRLIEGREPMFSFKKAK
jgi:glycerol-3-phosphate acyltransferase PlsY